MRDIMLIVHFIGVAMFVGTGFAFMFLEIGNSKLEKSESVKFTLRTFALSRMGHIGLFLLLISGFYLITPFWQSLGSNLLLIVKLVLVLILSLVIGIMASLSKKALKGDTEKYLKKLEGYSKISFILSLAIVVLAVLVFH